MTAQFSTITSADWVRSLSAARPHRAGQQVRIEKHFSRSMLCRLAAIAAGDGNAAFDQFPRATESTARNLLGVLNAATPDAPTEGKLSEPTED